jgi:hypothetical protein
MIEAGRYLVNMPSLAGRHSITATVTPFRQVVKEWLSPPDPSLNFYNARDTHHEGTTTWFIESTIFKDWKQSGSLFWIHGKRKFPSPITSWVK